MLELVQQSFTLYTYQRNDLQRTVTSKHKHWLTNLKNRFMQEHRTRYADTRV